MARFHKRTNPKVFGHAKQLHRNMTEPEAKLWSRLRTHRMAGVHFRDQHAIGNYVVDFCAPRAKLVIELDGPPFGRSISSRRSMMPNGLLTLSRKAIAFSVFGTTL
jgi:very-short-patch-repair endonuclease